MLIELKDIDVSKIADAIFLITGLSLNEKITEDRYSLSLGIKKPIEIGYDKKRKILTEENMSFSAHVKMLETLSQFMQDYFEFNIWLYEELN